jgi:hypothetical protein|nr:MAG TPA: hypothetical protein [Caudoviricetes sp.]
MQLTVELEGVDTLARLIAKYLADGSEFEVSKETNQIFVKVDDQEDGATEKIAVQQEEVKAEKKEAAAKPEETAYTLEEVIKAVKEYTLKDKEGAMKLKPVLQSLGAERLSLLPKEKLPEFIEGARKVGVEL